MRGRVANPRGYRQPREILNGCKSQAQFTEQSRGRADLLLRTHDPRSDTPADSKLAISVIKRAAESINGHAIAAPVPSPNLMPRSSKGFTSRWASSLRCACSAEQWLK